MVEIKYTENFKKEYSKLSKRNKKTLKKQLRHLVKDQFSPSLKTKKNYTLSKKYNLKVYESRVNKEYRFAWIYDGNHIILLLTVGDHRVVE
ncbi:MAG TPA: hypothetical protein VJ962_06560 [Clostridia bacterium]|nr:hypothetical protein [Clostridia bacterium]